jgi:Ferritin-like
VGKQLEKNPQIGSREELIQALHTAAELEHGLCCQYLFAAFTMRKTRTDFDSHPNLVVLQMAQRWAAVLMLVARQEMEHLALVCNLLNAVGGDLNFHRPNFPQPAERYPLHIPFRLEPFGVPALRRFVWFEKPENLRPMFSPDGYGHDHPRPEAALHLDLLAVPETRYDSVQKLFTEIRAAFQTLDPGSVFIGNPDRQVDGSQFANRITVEPVTNRKQAAAAIELIIEQGEGIGLTPLDPNGSHFQMLVQILRELEEAKETIPDFSPALNVVENPVLEQNPGAGPGTIVTYEPSRIGMELFNEAYQLLLAMLKSWFQCFSFSQNYPRQASEFYAAFFPLMTMVIRPLGEILTRMPAGVDGKNAGPSFELPPKADDQPTDREWYLRKLDELERRCADFRHCAPDFKSRLTFIRENIHATRLHFGNLWPEGPVRTKVAHFPI